MKSKGLAAIGIGACAAACAGALALPAMLGAGALGAGETLAIFSGASVEVVVCLIAAAAIAGVAFLWGRKTRAQATQQACATDGACGCKPGKADALVKT
jgi:hypothetical protein